MLRIPIAVLVIASLAIGVTTGYRWKTYTDTRTYYAGQSAGYLFGPSGVVNAKGEALSRQQLLDAQIELMVAQHPEWGLTYRK